MAFTQVPVVGTYQYTDGTAVSGTVTIEAPRPITNGTETFSSVTVTLSNGSIPANTEVPAFNDPGTVPFVEQGYKVTETLDGKSSFYYVYVRRSDQVLRLGETLKSKPESADAAVAEHEAKSDPHPVYLTQAEGDGRYATDSELSTGLADKADLDHTHSEYAAASHNHDGVYAPVSHTHTASQVTDLQGLLDDKSDVGHVHGTNAITGLDDWMADIESRLTAVEGA